MKKYQRILAWFATIVSSCIISRSVSAEDVLFYVNGTLAGIGRGHLSLISTDVTDQLKPRMNHGS